MRAKAHRSAKAVVARVLHRCGVLAADRRKLAKKQAVCVLGLHRVMTEEQKARANSQDGIILTDRVFENMMEYLVENFRLVSVEALLDAIPTADGPKPLCIVTFDDGWHDNYVTAFPILKRLGVPATILLATSYIGTSKTFWVEQMRSACNDGESLRRVRQRFAGALGKAGEAVRVDEVIEYLKHMPARQRQRELEEVLLPGGEGGEGDRMLTWEEVEQLEHAGISFGAHTVSHPLLCYEDEQTVEQELRESREQIESRLGTRVRCFAYPNGNWDARVRQWTEKVAYECAFTTQPGWHFPGEDRFTIKRFLLHDANVTGPDGKFSPAIFSLTLRGWR